jgi:DNA-binding transcriptional ArsR family regulator
MGTATSVHETFRALADPTRRRLVERLCAGPASMTELAQPFPITLPSLSKHLRVLEESGVVRSTKRGRVRTFRIVPGRLLSVEAWLARQRSLWERRLDQLEEHLQTVKEEEP